ncbi:hypothetical protein H2200_005755 [Cladophialophora chaetospira]|uniref:Tachykinin family protein n=1 Tax=Cladophialophora chaetospira TaxID=386627 RepID=A0AA38X9R8_9EURO|nr:hypothetical protein H2200_005755 [Cladophialophora chaetospira]
MGEIANSVEYRPAPASSNQTLFIVSSNVDKVNPTTRKIIRSHVMQGKKRKRAFRNEDRGKHRWSTTANRTLPLPSRVGSDLSFVRFADEIDPSTAISIIKFSTIATRILFPLLTAIGFRTDTTCSLGPIDTDAAVLHITAFAVDGFIERILRQQGNSTSPTAMLHLQKGTRMLRKRLMLGDDPMILSDSTMSAIVKLADTSHFDGDGEAAKQHMRGLRRLVDLRGGMDALGGTRALVEVLRCDLRIALLNDSQPVFYCQPSGPIPDYPNELLPSSKDKMSMQNDNDLIRNLDKNLATAWRVMSKFCLLVNLSTQTKRLIYPEFIHETLISVVYRLLNTGFAVGSLEEVVRLGLLAYSHHVFLQWQDVKLPLYPLLNAYRDAVLGLDVVDSASSELILWLLMTAAISLFNISDETWLRDCLWKHINKCQTGTWKGLQEILKSFMWIGLLDDEPGRQTYDRLFSEREKR